MRRDRKKRYAEDPEYRERVLRQSKEWRQRQPANAKYQKTDSEYHKKRYASDPEYRKKILNQAKVRYEIWKKETPWILHYRAAKDRCSNPNMACYKHYGGRGIRFLLTKLDIEILYKRDHADKMRQPSIDRINVNGDYHFGNCRFMEQSKNTRSGPMRKP